MVFSCRMARCGYGGSFELAAEIIIEDFNNAGGPLLEYGEPTERKIGPYVLGI